MLEESRRGGTPPIFSLFDQPLRRSPFFLGTPSVRTCPKASPVSVAHSPSRSRCLSQTSNPSFPKSPSPPSLHLIATPTKAITIERIATVRHFSREQNPHF